MKYTMFAGLPVLLALSACGQTDAIPLTVSAPNADSVSVRVDGNTLAAAGPAGEAEVNAKADAKARAACQAAGRNEAVFSTSQNVPSAAGFDVERLYICLT
ncbi:MAG: hypothetical protein ACWA5A_11875 [Marinibacterium sp.]